ncbi:hypothetical protein IG631_02940 [Alternaria alternata]|nr:hypothetical protein IG631_02940 [Alternaria alternata]
MLLTVFSQVSLLLTLTIHAAIIPDDRPEVIPGPGLPSLESLNLTSADLYELPLPGGSTGKTSCSWAMYSYVTSPNTHQLKSPPRTTNWHADQKTALTLASKTSSSATTIFGA